MVWKKISRHYFVKLQCMITDTSEQSWPQSNLSLFLESKRGVKSCLPPARLWSLHLSKISKRSIYHLSESEIHLLTRRRSFSGGLPQPHEEFKIDGIFTQVTLPLICMDESNLFQFTYEPPSAALNGQYLKQSTAKHFSMFSAFTLYKDLHD